MFVALLTAVSLFTSCWGANNPPRFAKDVYAVRVSEDARIGTVISVITASDADDGSNGELFYQLADSPRFSVWNTFSINGVSGEIVLNDLLDREREDAYRFSVTVTDGGGEQHRTEVFVTVLDVNDNRPAFPTTRYSFSVSENVGIGTKVADIRASDPDLGLNGTVQYRLLENPLGLFTIYENTGSLLVSRQIDREVLSSGRVTLMVEAFDMGMVQMSSEVIAEIEVVDEADTPPIFSNETYEIVLLESQPVGEVVLDINADSPDSNVIIEYGFEGTSGPFHINKQTGEMLTAELLDFEKQEVYSLVIFAGGRLPQDSVPSIRSIASVLVRIHNVNDAKPAFSKVFFRLALLEGQPAGYQVGQVEAYDADKGLFGRLHYSIVNASHAVPFDVVGNGIIITKRVLDFEDNLDHNGYIFTLAAQDGGSPAESASVQVHILVEDRNEPPTFRKERYAATVQEEAMEGTTVATVEAVDLDRTESAVFYTLLSFGNLQNSFVIDEETGIITTRNRIDREEYDSFNLTVKATDGSLSNLFSTVTVTVLVDDINDNKPDFLEESYNFAVPESALPLQVLGMVASVDRDATSKNTATVYSSDNVPQLFHLEPDMGSILLKKGYELDYEDTSHYIFHVVAINLAAPYLSSTVQVSVELQDSNDNSPDFGNFPAAVSVTENQPAGTIVVSVYTTDLDDGANGRLREFLILGSSIVTETFRIDGNGIVTTAKKLDREEINHYDVTIRAIDAGIPAMSSDIVIRVNVHDIIDTPPEFSQLSYNVVITEFQPSGSTILNVSARSRDILEDEIILYYLKGDENTFGIQTRTGYIVTKADIDPLELSGRQFLLTVEAHVQNLSSEVSLSVTIHASHCFPLDVAMLFYFTRVTFQQQNIPVFLANILPSGSSDCAVEVEVKTPIIGIKNFLSIDPEGSLFVHPAVPPGLFHFNISIRSGTDEFQSLTKVRSVVITPESIKNAVYLFFPMVLANQLVARQLQHIVITLSEALNVDEMQILLLAIQDNVAKDGVEVLLAVHKTDYLSYMDSGLVKMTLLQQTNAIRSKLSPYPTEIGIDNCMDSPCFGLQECRSSFQFTPNMLMYTSPDVTLISNSFKPIHRCFCSTGLTAGSCSCMVDPCLNNPCQFGGTCVQFGNAFECLCPPYTTGEYCSTVCLPGNCNPCIPNPCKNGGVCLPTDTSALYKCHCSNPGAGPNCELSLVSITPSSRIAFPGLGSLHYITVSFEFATTSANALLMQNTGESQMSHCLVVELSEGQLTVTVRTSQSYIVSVSTSSASLLNDGEWHTAIISAKKKKLQVSVSGCHEQYPLLLQNGSNVGQCFFSVPLEDVIHVNGLLSLGSVSISARASSTSAWQFDGCLSNLRINNHLMDLSEALQLESIHTGCVAMAVDCQWKPCNRGKCYNLWNASRCQCETSQECIEDYGSSVTFTGSRVLLNLQETVVESIKLAFRTTQSQAVLLQIGSRSFMKIHFGTILWQHGEIMLKAPAAVSDGQWHTVHLQLSASSATAIVDNGRITAQTFSPGYVLASSIHLGGSNVSSNAFLVYKGCMASLQINGASYSLPFAQLTPGCVSTSTCDMNTCPYDSDCSNHLGTVTCYCRNYSQASDIVSGPCSDPCSPGPCLNGGTCIRKAYGRFSCQCPNSYGGEDCSEPFCPSYHHNMVQDTCLPCPCDIEGSLKLCNGTTQCSCKASTYNAIHGVQCQNCNCHPKGALYTTCNIVTGQCQCQSHVTGHKCDQCEEDYYGLDINGCKAASFSEGVLQLSEVFVSAADSTATKSALNKEFEKKLLTVATEFRTSVVHVITHEHGLVSYKVAGYFADSHGSPPTSNEVAQLIDYILRDRHIGVHTFSEHWLIGTCGTDGPCYPGVDCNSSEKHISCGPCPPGYDGTGITCTPALHSGGNDKDNDGIPDRIDNQPLLFNPNQFQKLFRAGKWCPAESGFNSTWSPTLTMLTDVKACPGSHSGIMTRLCTGSGWDPPNTTDCQLPISLHLLQIANLTTVGYHQSAEVVFQSLDLALELLSDTKQILTGDILAVAEYMASTITYELNAEICQMHTEWTSMELVKFLQIFNSLLEPSFNDLWSPSSLSAQLLSISKLLLIAADTNLDQNKIELDHISATFVHSVSPIFPTSVRNVSLELPEDIKGLSAALAVAEVPHLIAGESRVINSDILIVETMSSIDTSHLISPVVFLLTGLSEVHNMETADPRCVFLTDDLKWSDEGCELVGITGQGVTCSCKHLTAFAVSIDESSLKPRLYKVHPATYVLHCVASVLLLATIVIIICCRVGAEGQFIHCFLLISLLLSHLSFLIGIDRVEGSVIACVVLSFAQQLAYVSYMVWLCLELVFVTILMTKSFHHWSQLPFYFVAVGLFITVLLIGVTGSITALNSDIISATGYPMYCWLSPGGPVWGFIASIALLTIVAVCTAILDCIKYKFTDPNNKDLDSARFTALYVMLIFPVVIISWALRFLSVGASLPTFVNIVLQTSSAALSVLEALASVVLFGQAAYRKRQAERYQSSTTRERPDGKGTLDREIKSRGPTPVDHQLSVSSDMERRVDGALVGSVTQSQMSWFSFPEPAPLEALSPSTPLEERPPVLEGGIYQPSCITDAEWSSTTDSGSPEPSSVISPMGFLHIHPNGAHKTVEVRFIDDLNYISERGMDHSNTNASFMSSYTSSHVASNTSGHVRRCSGCHISREDANSSQFHENHTGSRVTSPPDRRNRLYTQVKITGRSRHHGSDAEESFV